MRRGSSRAAPTSASALAAYLPSPYTEQDARDYLARVRLGHAEGKQVQWAAADPDSDVMLANVGLPRLHRTSAEMGYWSHPDARGRGVMTEAVSLALGFVFADTAEGGLGMHRAFIKVAAGNEASQHVARANGFTEFGRERLSEETGDGSSATWCASTCSAMSGKRVGRDLPRRRTRSVRRQVTLRAHRQYDVDGIVEQCNDPEMQKFTSMPVPYSREDAKEFFAGRADPWENDTVWAFAIEADGGAGVGRFAGSINVRNSGSGWGEIGFGAHPGVRGRGVMTTAVRLIIDWAFKDQGLQAISWQAYEGNAASLKVAWKNGFTFEGTTRARLSRRGEPKNAWRASLLATDSREPKTRWLDPVILEDDKVRLRAVRGDDERRFLETSNDAESMVWLATIPFARDPAGFRRHLASRAVGCASGAVVEWAIADPAEDDYVGTVKLFGLNGLDYKSAEVGYRTHPDARGQRLVEGGADAGARHAFTPQDDGGLGLRRVSLGAGDRQLESLGVARALGFTETGRDRQNYDLEDGSDRRPGALRPARSRVRSPSSGRHEVGHSQRTVGHFGRTGVTARWAAPGRVNLIGEHVDYQDGLVLPFALPWSTVASVSVRPGDTVAVRSRGDAVEFHVATQPGDVEGWAAYVAGVVWALAETGAALPGLQIDIDSDVPVGAGLSSSAALECAVAAAITDELDLGLTAARMATLARRAENEYVGVPTGPMDQLASMLCTDGHALLLDCRDLTTRQVPLDVTSHGLRLLVIDTHAHHALVGGEYADRRHDCEAAAQALSLDSLRSATLDQVTGLTDESLRRRAHHVVSEIARVRLVAEILDAGRPGDIGAYLTASHESLRDDFEVSCDELDVAVDAAVDAGALGARMTGGGFGGCAVALARASEVEAVEGRVQAAYGERGWAPADVSVVQPSPGAHRLA